MATILHYESLHPQGARRGWEKIAAILVVVALTSVAAWAYRHSTIHGGGQDRVSINKQGFTELDLALDSFEVDNGRYPTESEGLSVLIIPPADESGKWRGPFLKQLPTDQWGHAYIYHAPVAPQIGYRLLSPGPDGIEGTSDDILPGN